MVLWVGRWWCPDQGYGGYPECWSQAAGCGPWALNATAAYIRLAASMGALPVRLGEFPRDRGVSGGVCGARCGLCRHPPPPHHHHHHPHHHPRPLTASIVNHPVSCMPRQRQQLQHPSHGGSGHGAVWAIQGPDLSDQQGGLGGYRGQQQPHGLPGRQTAGACCNSAHDTSTQRHLHVHLRARVAACVDGMWYWCG
jgi:hypothetical protein